MMKARRSIPALQARITSEVYGKGATVISSAQLR